MPLEIETRWFEADDQGLVPGWPLIEFLISIGADEFAVRFVYVGGDGGGKEECDQLFSRLAFAFIGERTRECTVTYASETNPRPAEVWRMDADSLADLREVMPAGVRGSPNVERARAEDLCVYRQGQLLSGAVSHEQDASARLTDAEWDRWESWSTVG
jgi:hypothetical protein